MLTTQNKKIAKQIFFVAGVYFKLNEVIESTNFDIDFELNFVLKNMSVM